MNSRNKIINIAIAELGTKESNNGDDKYIKWYGGFALTVAWCAIFVSWVVNQAKIATKIIPKFADCDSGMKWFKDRNLFKAAPAYGGKAYSPRKGDVIFFSDKYNEKDSTHVGWVTKSDKTMVYTIEGNSKDMVREKSYSLNSKYILGYGVPEYPDDNPYQEPDETVKIGSKGEGVMWVQWQLRKAGYTYVKVDGIKKELKIDGSCGSITDAGIRAYQLDHGLVVDGKAGPKTRETMNND